MRWTSQLNDDPHADDHHHDQRRHDEQLNDEAGRRRLDRRQQVVAGRPAGEGSARVAVVAVVGSRELSVIAIRGIGYRASPVSRTDPAAVNRTRIAARPTLDLRRTARLCDNDAMQRLLLTLDTPADNLALDEALLDGAEAEGPNAECSAGVGVAAADRRAGPVVARGRGGRRRRHVPSVASRSCVARAAGRRSSPGRAA